MHHHKSTISSEIKEARASYDRAIADYTLNGFSKGRIKRLEKCGTRYETLTKQFSN